VVHETSAVWQDNQKQITIEVPVSKDVKSIVLDGGLFMDADETNNTWKAQ
jgi:hypothetical protein